MLVRWMRCSLWSMVWASTALALAGCASETDSEPEPGAGGGTPSTCQSWETERPDGSCQTAGIPPDECAEGFIPADDASCEPVLPDAPCAEGTMAVVGETSCRAPAPCGAAPWGDIPVDTTTQYVDASFAGTSTGAETAPWATIQEAIDAVVDGGLIAITDGSYNEALTITGKRVRLWGRCPEAVELVGGNDDAALRLSTGSNGSEVRGIAITGPARGIGLRNTVDVVVAGVWIHDTGMFGVVADAIFGPSAVTLEDVLVERASGLGVFALGGSVTADRIEVRDTQLSGEFGWGLGAVQSTASAASAAVSNSVFTGNRDVSISVLGSHATIASSVVQDGIEGQFVDSGRGINFQNDPEFDTPASGVISTSVVRRNKEMGIVITASNVEIETTVVRDSLVTMNGVAGRGIQVQANPMTGATAEVTIRRSSLLDNRDTSVFVVDATLTIERSRIVRTTPQDRMQFGDGVAAWGFNTDAYATITGSVIRDNARAGVSSFGAHLALGSSQLSCNQFDLNGEQWTPRSAQLEDLGDNVCGCGDETHECRSVSTGLEPPPVRE
jgi:hypothetical protein